MVTPETLAIIEDFVALRTPILVRVLEMAVRRGTEEQLQGLRDILGGLREVIQSGDNEAAFLADLSWFEGLLQASNSLLYRSVYRPFSAVYKRFSGAVSTFWRPPAGYPEALERVMDAIEKRDVKEAVNLLEAYLELESNRLQEALSTLTEMLEG